MKKIYYLIVMLFIFLFNIFALEPKEIQQQIDEADKIIDPAKKLVFYEKIFGTMQSIKPTEDQLADGVTKEDIMCTIVNCDGVLYELINLYVSVKPEMPLKSLLSKINNFRVKEQKDLDGDGENDIFIIGHRGHPQMMLYSYKGENKIFSMDSVESNIGNINNVKFYDCKKDGKKVFIIRSGGDNGKAASMVWHHAYILENGAVKEIFQAPVSYYPETEYKDIDNDGKEELVCNELLDGDGGILGFRLKAIFKWTGEGFENVSLMYPNVLVDSYKKSYDELLEDIVKYGTDENIVSSYRKISQENIYNKSSEYAEFYKEKLKPIEEKFEKDLAAAKIVPKVDMGKKASGRYDNDGIKGEIGKKKWWQFWK